MKALVFAAGLGTRLGEFTQSHPKALVEVGGRTMLERVLLRLRDAGVDDVVINVHHFPEQIEECVRAHGNFGMHIAFSRESEMLLETGGGLLAAAPLLDAGNEPFIIHNADILTDFPLHEMLTVHAAMANRGATLLVGERDTARYLIFDEEGRMRGWTNVTTGAVRPEGFVPDYATMVRRAFGGVHVFSPALFPALRAYNDSLAAAGAPTDSRGICRFSIMNFYIDNCAACDIQAFEPSAPYLWCDIGKPDSLEAARRMVHGQ